MRRIVTSRLDEGSFILTFLAILFLLITACQQPAETKGQTNDQTKDQMPTRDIIAVQEDHTAELMTIPGVTGTAIGELEDHTPCILVLVEEETPELKAKIPAKLEGHPTKLFVTGKIVPMGPK